MSRIRPTLPRTLSAAGTLFPRTVRTCEDHGDFTTRGAELANHPCPTVGCARYCGFMGYLDNKSDTEYVLGIDWGVPGGDAPAVTVWEDNGDGTFTLRACKAPAP